MTSYLESILANVNNGRIRNELLSYEYTQQNMDSRARFPVNKNATLCTVAKDPLSVEATFLLNVDHKKTTVVNLIFNNNRPYPFYAPEIKIFYYDYSEMLRTDLSTLPDIEKICLCCSSLTCKNNWNLTRKLTDIFEEIRTNLSLKIRISDKILCKHVVNQKIGTYVPVDEFL